MQFLVQPRGTLCVKPPWCLLTYGITRFHQVLSKSPGRDAQHQAQCGARLLWAPLPPRPAVPRRRAAFPARHWAGCGSGGWRGLWCQQDPVPASSTQTRPPLRWVMGAQEPGLSGTGESCFLISFEQLSPSKLGLWEEPRFLSALGGGRCWGDGGSSPALPPGAGASTLAVPSSPSCAS